MKLKAIVLLCAAALVLTACHKTGESTSNPVDSIAVLPDLVADSALTATAKYYADMVDASASDETLAKADSIIRTDMQDLRDTCDFVFYPFSGPDFFYPFTLFPNADTYFLLGLEKPGSILTNVDHDKSRAAGYKHALSIYLHSSFFRTLSMKNDLSNASVDGTVPVISMLMAKKDCKIISVKYKELDADGKLVDSEKMADIVEFKFFNAKTPKHEQTLYYYSGNAADSGFDENVRAWIDRLLDNRNVVTFLKAASYLMHEAYFSKPRDLILNHSLAVIQDDSGIPYRYFRNNWDVTLYGTYKRPLGLFRTHTYQHDLDSAYHQPGIKPLDLRIGYNTRSNWMCARKK